MAIFVGLILAINFVAEVGLIKGRRPRTKLLPGPVSYTHLRAHET